MRIGARSASSARSIGRQRNASAAGAENDRRDHDMEPVEASRREKTRHGVGTAFDQDAAQAALGQRRQDGGRRDPRRRLSLAVTTISTPAGIGERAPVAIDQAADAVCGEQPGAGRQPAVRVDHHPCRVGAGHPPDRELRVVGERGPDPDHHRIDQRSQPVQMGKRRQGR